MLKWILIAAGGAFGSVGRYALHTSVQRLTSSEFPFGTLAVNLLGCLIIGILSALFSGPYPVREEYRLGLIVGILGGFTTFSAFGLETYNLANHTQLKLALLNVALSCGLGIAAVWLGDRAAQYWWGT